MTTDLDDVVNELVRDVFGVIAKAGLSAWQAFGGIAETQQAPTRDEPGPTTTAGHTFPIVDLTMDVAAPGSFLPRSFKTENDNGVIQVRGNGYRSECHSDPVIVVQRAFEGGHSLTHTLRFAAWLVKLADQSDDYEDFFKVLSAVTDEEG
jgi:hypothetical protein